MTFEKCIKTDKDGHPYHADKHSPNLKDFLGVLDLRTANEIYNDLTCRFSITKRRGNESLLEYHARMVKHYCQPIAESRGIDGLFEELFPDYEQSDIEDVDCQLPDLLDNLSLETLGKIMGDLHVQDVEWFNDNVTCYKQLVIEAGGRAIDQYLPVWQEAVNNGMGYTVFTNNFDVHYGGRSPEWPYMIQGEWVVGKNEEGLTEAHNEAI